MHDWSKAAEKYRQARVEDEVAKRNIITTPLITVSPELVRKEAKDLEDFLASQEGIIALELLKASGTHIIFGEDRPDGGFGTVYFLGGDGLQKSVEPMGLWIAYAEKIPKPIVTKIAPRHAVEAFWRAIAGQNRCHSVFQIDVLSWLLVKIDKIAKAAPGE